MVRKISAVLVILSVFIVFLTLKQYRVYSAERHVLTQLESQKRYIAGLMAQKSSIQLEPVDMSLKKFKDDFVNIKYEYNLSSGVLECNESGVDPKYFWIKTIPCRVVFKYSAIDEGWIILQVFSELFKKYPLTVEEVSVKDGEVNISLILRGN